MEDFNFYYLIRLQYLGTHYHGWQIQVDEKTIQGELNKALSLVLNNKNFKTLGASRTDAGVHALDQVCKISLKNNIPPQSLKLALNKILPKDISVKDCQNIQDSFHPIYHVERKTYSYYFTQSKTSIDLDKRLYSYSTSFDLDLDKMNLAAQGLIGEFDFQNYFTLGSEHKSTIRSIYKAQISSVSEHHPFFSNTNELYVFSISGNGFLKQMIRLLMGALLEIGKNKVSVEDFFDSLRIKKDKRIGPVVPAHGLFLEEIILSKK